MNTSHKIRIYLLCDSPVVMINDEKTEVQKQPMELLAYLSVENVRKYERETLIKRLFEGSFEADPATRFRTHLVYNQPDEIKEEAFHQNKKGKPDFHFDNQNIWVDALEFEKQAQRVKQMGTYISNVTQIKMALNLYEDRFLANFEPSLPFLKEWRDEKQEHFAELRRQLLQKMVQYYIHRKDFTSALRYAEDWYKTDQEPQELPIHHLIWLHFNMYQTESANQYLRELREYEEEIGLEYGLTPTQWQDYAANHPFIPESVLPIPVPKLVNFDQLEWEASDLAGRQPEIQDIMENLLLSRIFPCVCVTGPSGIGKTTVLRTVQGLARQMPQVDRVIHLTASSETTRESLIDEILHQLGHPQAFVNDISRRQKQLAHLLKANACLLCLDDDAANSTNWSMVFDLLIPILGSSYLLCATQQLNDKNPDVHRVKLSHLTVEEIGAWLIDEYDDHSIENLHRITDGLPLTLHILRNFMRARRMRVYDLADSLKRFKQLNNANSDTSLFDWLWQQLSPEDHAVLFGLSVGSGQEGIPDSIVPHLMGIPEEQLTPSLHRLLEMQLVTQRHDDEVRYYIHNELKRILANHDDQYQVSKLRERFVSYFCEYVSEHKDDFNTLDQHRYNILYALSLGSSIQNERFIDALIDSYAFLDRCGFYQASTRIMEEGLDKLEMLPEERIRLLNNIGKLYTKLGQHDLAIAHLETACDLIEQHNLTEYQSAVFQNLGIIDLRQGKYLPSADHFAVAYQAAQAHMQDEQRCRILGNSATLAALQGDYAQSQQYCLQCLELARDLNDRQAIEFAQTALGYALSELGDPDAAKQHFQASLTLLDEIGDVERKAYVLMNLGVLSLTARRMQEAEHFLQEGYLLAQQIGHMQLQAQIGWNIGDVMLATKPDEAAEKILKKSFIQAEDSQHEWLATGILNSLGKLYCSQQRWDLGKPVFEKALLRMDHPEFNVQSLYGWMLTVVAPDQFTGKQDANLTYQMISDALQEPLRSRIKTIPITVEALKAAEAFFQQDLEHISQLPRFAIIPALLREYPAPIS